MNKLFFAAAFAVILSNAVILTEVIGNRSGGEKQTLTLSAQEFFLIGDSKENSAIYLDLNWKSSTELTKEQKPEYSFYRRSGQNVYLPEKRKELLFGKKAICSSETYDRNRTQQQQVDLIFGISEERRQNYINGFHEWISLEIAQATTEKDKERLQRRRDEFEADVSALFLLAVLHPDEETPLEYAGKEHIRLHGLAKSYSCHPEIRIDMVNNDKLFVEKAYRELIKENPDNYLLDLNIGSNDIPWLSNIRLAE